MAREAEEAFAARRRPGGRHLAPEEPKRPEKRSRPREENSAGAHTAGMAAPVPGKRREAVRRGEPMPARRPAKPGLARKRPAAAAHVDAETFYRHFVPYIEEAHHRNERSLKAGVWLLVLLPAILAVIRELTDASRIVFLIFWIIGMFGIATALIFTAYADHDLKKTLEELKELVPPEEEIELGNLLPVDAEGEGWLIDPEELPIPLPDLSERLQRPKKRQRRERQQVKREKQPEGKHLKRE